MEPPKLEDYRMTAKLGEGTFSEVMKVKHKITGKVLAMKRFRKKFNSAEEISNLREIQALKRLSPNENIIDLIDVIFDLKTGTLGLTFELMDCNLYELLSRKNMIINEDKAKNLFYQIMKAVEFTHSKGIFHRDIKPENILIKENTIKLADFGSCRGIHSKPPYTEYIATRWYRAPECLLCDGTYNFKMDIWGAGCVLYEMITKVPLFPGSNELDQLHKIHDVTGAPSPSMVKKLQGTRKLTQDYNFPPKQGSGLRALLPGISIEGINIMNDMLAYDPDDRINAKDCLKHLFFRDIQSEATKEVRDAAQEEKKDISKYSISDLDEKGVIKSIGSKSQQIETSTIKSSLKAKIPDMDINHKDSRPENESSNKPDSLPHIDDKPSKSALTTVGLSTKATIFGNEFKQTKYASHDNGVIDVANQSLKKHPSLNHTTTLPKINNSNSIISPKKLIRQPTFEVTQMNSNYHIIRKNEVEKEEKSSNLSYRSRYNEDNKTLDVALARARRAVKRQNEINSGKLKRRLSQKGSLGLNVVGNQKV